MGLSSKLFLIAADDTLHALAGTAFMRMLRQDDVARLPDFAGQRVRMASLVVEKVDRTKLRTVHQTFSLLDIGADGLLDVARQNVRQAARLDDLLAGVLKTSTTGRPVVDAASKFIARGGSWTPDEPLLRRIEAAAFGRVACRRVRVVR